jgi:hypothetical protein
MDEMKEPTRAHKETPPKDLCTALVDTSKEFDIESVDAEGVHTPALATTITGKPTKRRRRGGKGPKGISWELAKQVYVETTITFLELAHLLGCSEAAIAARSSRSKGGSWVDARKAHRLDAKLHGVERMALKEAMEKSSATQEAGAELALAALQIIVDDLKEWRERKKQWIETDPAIPFPEKIPLSARDINSLTSAMNRLEAWDRAKLGAPDARIAIDTRTVDLTALLDGAHE